MKKAKDISKVYVLCHSYEKENGDLEMKNLFYSLKKYECKKQILYYKDLPGFRDYPEGFEVLYNELECYQWETGFGPDMNNPEHVAFMREFDPKS